MGTEQGDWYAIADQERERAENASGQDSSSDCNGDCSNCDCLSAIEPSIEHAGDYRIASAQKPESLFKRALHVPGYIVFGVMLVIHGLVVFIMRNPVPSLIVTLILLSWIF